MFPSVDSLCSAQGLITCDKEAAGIKPYAIHCTLFSILTDLFASKVSIAFAAYTDK